MPPFLDNLMFISVYLALCLDETAIQKKIKQQQILLIRTNMSNHAIEELWKVIPFQKVFFLTVLQSSKNNISLTSNS